MHQRDQFALERRARLRIGLALEAAVAVQLLQLLQLGAQRFDRGIHRDQDCGRAGCGAAAARRSGRRPERGKGSASVSKASSASRERRRSTITSTDQAEHQQHAGCEPQHRGGGLERRAVQHEVAVARGHVVEDLAAGSGLAAASRAPGAAGRPRGRHSSRRWSGSGTPGSAARRRSRSCASRAPDRPQPGRLRRPTPEQPASASARPRRAR